MYRNILIATDGSELAGHAVEQGLGLAKAVGAAVTVVTVTDMYPTSSGVMLPTAADVARYEAAAAKGAKAILDRVAATAGALGVACSLEHVVDEQPAAGILQACARHRCDLIVMATHGRRGLDRLLLGSQTSEVITSSKVAVLVCR